MLYPLKHTTPPFYKKNYVHIIVKFYDYFIQYHQSGRSDCHLLSELTFSDCMITVNLKSGLYLTEQALSICSLNISRPKLRDYTNRFRMIGSFFA